MCGRRTDLNLRCLVVICVGIRATKGITHPSLIILRIRAIPKICRFVEGRSAFKWRCLIAIGAMNHQIFTHDLQHYTNQCSLIPLVCELYQRFDDRLRILKITKPNFIELYMLLLVFQHCVCEAVVQ